MIDKLKRRSTIYKAVLNTDLGRELLVILADECLAYKPTFVVGDSHQTAFNEGKRQVYNHLIGLSRQDPSLLQAYYQKINEQQQLQAFKENEDII